MRQVKVSVEIERPAEEVFAFLEQVENSPLWLSNLRSCVWTSPPPICVGSTYDQVARFLGKDIAMTFEVTQLDRPRIMTVTSRHSPFPLTIAKCVAALTPERCKVTGLVDADPSEFYPIAAPVLASTAERDFRRDYRQLKCHLESAAQP
jgi:hypothetical protein